MKNPKVWLIWGATEGLGPAAVKYLLANQQIVIPVAETAGTLPDLVERIKRVRPLDFIVNNSNYRLFAANEPDIASEVFTTIKVIESLLPYLSQEPKGCIINIPPQLCLATMADPTKGPGLQQEMDLFLTNLRRNLALLDCNLRFLELGERIGQL